MKRIVVLLGVSILALTGCAGQGIEATVLNTLLGGTGEIGSDIIEASVAKELVVHKTLQNRDKMYRQAYEDSGFKIEFKLEEFGGVAMYLPKTIEYKPEPQFDQPLPTEPSKHPVWAAAENLGGVLAQYGLIGFGLHEVAGIAKYGMDQAGATTYNGPLLNSNNDVAGDMTNGDLEYSIKSHNRR